MLRKLGSVAKNLRVVITEEGVPVVRDGALTWIHGTIEPKRSLGNIVESFRGAAARLLPRDCETSTLRGFEVPNKPGAERNH